MLCQFTFKNFRSYKDETTFSMQATSMREFSDSLIVSSDGQTFLPLAAVYGPNAGGKSNVFHALNYVCAAVAHPIVTLTNSQAAADGTAQMPQQARILPCAPFAFDTTCQTKPSEFEIYFRAGSHEYRFNLEIAGAHIQYEALYRRKIGASRAAMLYTRQNADVTLGAQLKRAGISTNFNPAITYLAFLYMNTKNESITEAAEWFVSCTFLDYNSAGLEPALEQCLNDKHSTAITELLNSVDIRIDGFRTEKVEDAGTSVAAAPRQRVFVTHKVNDSRFELRLTDESAGTQKMLGLAGFLLLALANGSTLFVDELDAKLHPKLLRFITILFRNPKVNTHGAQLIFTSQDVSTMRSDVFRRDEIWFAAKDEAESSQLWSLADIRENNGNPVSKNAAFDRQYLAGRYGADPYLTRMDEWAKAGSHE
jgi:hypothetical protein